MKASSAISTALAAAILLFNAVAADVDPIVIKGSKFFYQTNGTQFYIKGVAYQQDYTGGGAGGSGTASGGNNQYVDPLASPSNCQRDIPYLVQLQTNTIRVYAIDPTQNHDECMSMLADAGIYVIADLSAPGDSINRADPTWDDTLYARYTSVIDVMQQYTNTLGFFAGNEVSNNSTNTDASAFVKAAVRDMKAYIKAKNYRAIGVGYATNDDAEIRVDLADYFNCGDQTDAIDFWGYNIYSWCGASSYTLSGYNERTAEFSTYSVPVFFAEYGCNQVEPRIFTEVAALYGPQMNDVWSGGIVYMYFQEANDYGLVSVSGNSVQTLTDFDNLSSQIAKISPTGVNAASYNPTNSPQACPTVGADWGADSNLPPTPNEQLCDCMYSALTCQPSSEVTDTNIGELFGLVCGLSELACIGISANATDGKYGSYSQCNPNQQMGWALNAYYEIQNQASDACDFSGSATLNPSPVSPTGTCSELVSQAGGQGTGTVTSAPTNTGGSSSSGSSGSGSTSSGAAVPGMSALASLNFGVVHIAAYLVLAVGTGAGMILL